jgi:hypothetical protein
MFIVIGREYAQNIRFRGPEIKSLHMSAPRKRDYTDQRSDSREKKIHDTEEDSPRKPANMDQIIHREKFPKLPHQTSRKYLLTWTGQKDVHRTGLRGT